VKADKAGGAGDKNPHRYRSPLLVPGMGRDQEPSEGRTVNAAKAASKLQERER
jgi:hypothetical protein